MNETEIKETIIGTIHNYGETAAADIIWVRFIEPLQAELADRQVTIKHLRSKAEFDMPDEMRGRFHNGKCPEACDMVDGPCACGATHKVKEWLGKLVKDLTAAEKENEQLQAEVDKIMNEVYMRREETKNLRQEIRARRQWQKCPQCNKTFATQP